MRFRDRSFFRERIHEHALKHQSVRKDIDEQTLRQDDAEHGGCHRKLVPMPYVDGGRRTFTNTRNKNQWFEVCDDEPTVAMATRRIRSAGFPEGRGAK